MSTLTYTGRLTICNCWCGITLAIPEDLYRVAHSDGKNVYCPLGHSFVWGETTTEKKLAKAEQDLRRTRAQVAATQELLEHETHSHRATRGHMTRIKKRVAAGVCPCCNRSFKDLARHMEGQHPDYVK
jgi:hypothetical protein